MKRKWNSPSQLPSTKKATYNKKRAEVISYLGGKCCKCGFTDIRALQIDHIAGGGTEERRQYGGISLLNKMLKTLHIYQLLCANCNWIKRAESEDERPKGKQVFIDETT